MSRPNRFIAQVEIDGKIETVHVKNTGRCKELLQPGCTVFLERASNPDRKTLYDLVAVKKGELLINMDSQLPNAVLFEWLWENRESFSIGELRREVKYGNSRFDLYGKRMDGQPFFIEVKGVTLEEDGVVRFPDAPTQRGLKHVEELIAAKENGYECAIVFVIQMEQARYLEPNYETQPAFGEALKRARAHGVKVVAFCCRVKPDEMCIERPVEVRLQRGYDKEEDRIRKRTDK